MAKRIKKSKQKKKNNTRYLIASTVIIAVVIVLALGFVFRQQTKQPITDNGITLRDSDTAFSFSTLVGQPAPEFTAIGVDGQPYTVTPGDGRAKAIIFYMGFR